jgi:hypothetical protein
MAMRDSFFVVALVAIGCGTNSSPTPEETGRVSQAICSGSGQNCNAGHPACCSGLVCEPFDDTCGHVGSCTACGATGQPCCASGGGSCNAGNNCTTWDPCAPETSNCVACGGCGQPCCVTGTACTTANTACDSGSSLCLPTSSYSAGCGALGQPCCGSGDGCAGHVCEAGLTCLPADNHCH